MKISAATMENFTQTYQQYQPASLRSFVALVKITNKWQSLIVINCLCFCCSFRIYGNDDWGLMMGRFHQNYEKPQIRTIFYPFHDNRKCSFRLFIFMTKTIKIFRYEFLTAFAIALKQWSNELCKEYWQLF